MEQAAGVVVMRLVVTANPPFGDVAPESAVGHAEADRGAAERLGIRIFVQGGLPGVDDEVGLPEPSGAPIGGLSKELFIGRGIGVLKDVLAGEDEVRAIESLHHEGSLGECQELGLLTTKVVHAMPGVDGNGEHAAGPPLEDPLLGVAFLPDFGGSGALFDHDDLVAAPAFRL